MVRLIVLVLTVFACNSLQAGNAYTELLLKVKPERVEAYKLLSTNPAPVLVRMPFNSDSILNPEVFARLRGIKAARIDLVYTAYREAKSFDQPLLNRGRLDSLLKYGPALLDDPLTEWHFVAQTGATTADSAAKLFHGFVIYPRKEVSEADSKIEMTFLETTMDSINCFLLKEDSICVIPTMRFKTRWVPTGYYIPKSRLLQKRGVKSLVKGSRYPYMEKALTRDTIIKYDSVRCYGGPIDSRIFQYLPDSTVIKVLERHPEWKNKLVVTDVTGSMSPYSAQLLVWYKLRKATADVKWFTFFNDGDNATDNRKTIGRTGGIYMLDGRKPYDDMQNTMQEAMRKGNGGDAPENNIEALLKGLEYCPECTDVIMIADNSAPVKDLMLLNKVNRPIKIVLCGADNGIINAEYLDIARKTGGSVHLLNQDVTDLMKMNEGEMIELGTRRYKIINGKFTVVGFL